MNREERVEAAIRAAEAGAFRREYADWIARYHGSGPSDENEDLDRVFEFYGAVEALCGERFESRSLILSRLTTSHPREDFRVVNAAHLEWVRSRL